MTTRHKHRFWRLLRIYFRRFRITVWFCILLLLGTIIYLNRIGLPEFVKKPLLEKLRASGVDLQFSRLRLRWPQGIVAEDVRFGKATDASHPELRAALVQVHLDYRALAKLHLQVDSLRLRRGSFIWPMPDPKQTNRQLALEDIQTDLELLPGDQWQLEHFTAGFAGARIQLSGAVTNASAIRDWKMLHRPKTGAAGHWQERLRAFADTLQKIQFSATPDLRLDVRGDARDPLTFQVRIMVNTPGAITPWGTVDDGKLVARLLPGASNEISRIQLHLEAAGGKTEWASATNLHLNVNAVSRIDETNRVQCDIAVSAAAVETKWGQAANVHFDAEWIHGLTNAVPLMGRGELICGNLETKWCSAGEVDLKGELDEHAGFNPPTDESWAWWAGLAPYPLQWQLQAKDFEREGLHVASMSGTGRWRAPELTLTNLHAELYDRNLLLNADLDVATRKLQTHVVCDVDPHKVEHVLTKMARQWLAQFTWNTPPRVDGTLALVLPAWTNSNPDWRAEARPGLLIAGKFEVPDGGTFRGVPALSARSSFLYSNMTWHLPDLVATRPEGRIELLHTSSDRTKAFYYKFHSSIDPIAVLPLLGTNEARGLRFFTFSAPPSVEAEVWGHWHHEEAVGFKGHAALTHFTFKGEKIDALRTSVTYSNRMLSFTDPEAFRGPQVYRADSVKVDFDAEKVYLTNGFSTGDPMVVARAIGPHIVRAIEPYQFLLPPIAHVHGVIPMRRDEDADLYFQLSGGPFRWMKFRVPQISGEVHWAGRHLSITDVESQFYGGKLKGSAGFEFTEDRGTEYHFTALATNVALDTLVGDLTTRTNHLEGTLEGRVTVKRGNLSKTNDVDGDGYVSLRDGLLWTIPIFGVFSGPLDRIHQGLGSSAAKEGEGHFSITNGVIYSADTEIRSPALRLEYRGAVDLDGNVNARVEAQVLRDVWLIGPIVSTVLWPFAKMFEYKVTGTLAHPKTELLYFGKLAGTPETETSLPEKRTSPQGAARPP